MADPICADCGGWDIEWMRHCRKHKGVETCRGCECPYCAEDDMGDYEDYCDDYYDPDYEDRPLYQPGRIAGMTDAELIAEARRQCYRHDSAVDRCEELNSPTIEDSAAKLNICRAECKKRGLNWLDGWDEESPDKPGERRG